jgi:sulfoxide reductase heme-binding subunit YedZ
MAWTLEPPRLRNHLLLAGVTALGCYATHRIQPLFPWVLTLTIALGYLALLFLAISLLLGPLGLRRRGRNPVNLHLRRDVGIWAGLTGVVHVVLGLQIHAGGQILRYFFGPDGGLLLNLFGLSNDLGAAATVILLALLALSNDWALRRLRGPRWKAVQRLNYVLFPLVIGHTLGYQIVVAREHIMGWVVGGVIAVVLLGQLWGVSRTLAHRARRHAAARSG